MDVFRTRSESQAARQSMNGTVGFVPTMGALHDGHTALLRRCRAENDLAVFSIYVNPTQFDNVTDLERYPRTLETDLETAKGLGMDAAILPSYTELYHDDFRFRVDETALSRELCGAHRPGHFTGVLTVVLKLFNLVRPTRAYFGEKDYQQYLLIRDMCSALFVDVEIVPCATVREADGLALSSRNERLDSAARTIAPQLYELLSSRLDDAVVARRLAEAGFSVDYVETRDGRRYGAASLASDGGQVRLIDNVARNVKEQDA
jgi:pantoate--beta-alanine ligase